jgi:streptogramin lyase
LPTSRNPIASPNPAHLLFFSRTRLREPFALLAIAACIVLSGCGVGTTSSTTPPPPPPTTEPNNCKSVATTSPYQPTPTSNYTGPNLTGVVRGGSLPLIGASVQLYAAGTSGNGSAPTALLTTPLTTDANGAFTSASNITCPLSNSVLYVVARGGHAGTSGASNSGTVLTTILGPCNSLSTSLNIVVNEATTVATVWAMAQFLAAGGNIGSSSTNNSGLSLAAATAANLVNPATGSAPGATFPATATSPAAKINTLSNILNPCITSSGPSSSACTGLYASAKTSSTPLNTLDAAMNIVQHPGDNIASVFALSSGSSAYSPQLNAAPADWTLFVTYSGAGMNGPSAVSIDSTGNVWVASYYAAASLFSNTGSPIFPNGITGNNLSNSYGGAVDVTDTMWVANEQSPTTLNAGLGSLTLLNTAGASPAAYSSGGINFPIAIAFDTSGVAWIANYGNSGVTLLSSAGSPLSGASGYTSANLAFPVAIATDSKCNAYVANQSSNTITRILADGSAFTDFTTGDGGSGLAIDASDNVWVANYYANSVGLVSSAGTVLSGSGFTASSLNQPQGIAVDSAGNAWIASYRGSSLTELSAASSNPGTILSPAAGWAPDSKLLEPYALAIDASGNIWVSNFGSNTLTEFIGLAAPVKTPPLGPVRTP